MTQLKWDQSGERFFETGVDHGVLYPLSDAGQYDQGYAWNGLTAVTQSPSGAEPTAIYADNIKYLNLISAEDFSGTIEALYSPPQFDACDGTATPVAGVAISQQNRRSFGFSWRTLIGNDVVGTNFGYKIHLAYGATAAPSEKNNATVNETPEAMPFSWSFSTTPVDVPGGLKPSAHIVIDSTQVSAAALATLEGILYGTAGTNPRLPLPAEVIALFQGAVTEVTPVKPTQAGNVVTIPATAGLIWSNSAGVLTPGAKTITKDTVISVRTAPGFKFPTNKEFDTDWLFPYTP